MSPKIQSKLKPDIRPMAFEIDGEIVIRLIDFNGKKPSPEYYYSTRTGKVSKKSDKCPLGEWIGEISVSPSMSQRIWVAAKNLFEDFGIPTEPKALEEFINARGDKGPWYSIGNDADGILGSIYLPHVLEMAKHVNDKSSDTAIVGNVCVSPKHLRKGVGSLLHILAAAHLKTQGYKTLTSDIVGFNTGPEMAVWKSLRNNFDIESCRLRGFSMVRVLKNLNVIDHRMAKLLNTKMGIYINGHLMSLQEISKRKFPQFKLDLTDERVPLLEQVSQKAA